MAASYEGLGERPIGTMTCDGCGTTWSDGIAETEGPGIRQRVHEAAGWRMYRPNAYQAEDLCPECFATSRMHRR